MFSSTDAEEVVQREKVVQQRKSGSEEESFASETRSNTPLSSFASDRDTTSIKEPHSEGIQSRNFTDNNEIDNEIYRSFPFLFPFYTDGGVFNISLPSKISYIDIADVVIAKYDTVYSTGQNPFVVYEVVLTTQLIKMRKIQALEDNQNRFSKGINYTIKNQQQIRIYRRYDLFAQLHKSLLKYLTENTDELVTFLNRREKARGENDNNQHQRLQDINDDKEKSTESYTKSNLLQMLLPTLPKKTIFATSRLFGFGGHEEKEFEKLDARQKDLELYLKSLLKEDILRTSDTFRAFFDIDSFIKCQNERNRGYDQRERDNRIEGGSRGSETMAPSYGEHKNGLVDNENKDIGKITRLSTSQYPENPPQKLTAPRSTSLTSFSDTLISNSVYHSRVNQDVVRNALIQQNLRKDSRKKKRRIKKRSGSQDSYNSTDSTEADGEGTICTLNLCMIM